MKSKIFSAYTIVSMLVVGMPVFAMPNHTAMELETPGITKTIYLPAQADNSPVISLGSEVDPATGNIVEGFMFIHYKKGFAKPEGVGKKPGGGGDSCYAFLGNGAKWKTTENYVFNAANTRGLNETTLRTLLAQGLAEWDDEITDVNIFGDEVSGTIDPNTIDLNKTNEVFFADIDTNGVIAVTTIWGVFRGPTSGRYLAEWDMIFDDVSFDWSAEELGVAGKMDFLNIAVHEIGHAAGMGHPSDNCTEETMYRYGDTNEIKKRDLHDGDITGIKALY